METDTLAHSVNKSFGKLSKAGRLNSDQLAINKKKNNLLLSILNQKIALRVWKEYLLIKDKFAAREGGIVSDVELNRLISKQRLEEIKFYNKNQAILSQSDIPLRKESALMLDSFHNIYRVLRDSSIVVT